MLHVADRPRFRDAYHNSPHLMTTAASISRQNASQAPFGARRNRVGKRRLDQEVPVGFFLACLDDRGTPFATQNRSVKYAPNAYTQKLF